MKEEREDGRTEERTGARKDGRENGRTEGRKGGKRDGHPSAPFKNSCISTNEPIRIESRLAIQ